MGQTTLEQAARWVADATGLCWPADQTKAVTAANDVRELLYDLSCLPWNVTLCAPTTCFCQECCECGYVYGVSLPPYVENILAVWHGSRPVPIVDRWTIYPYDAEYFGCYQYQIEDLGSHYPFLRDPPCGKCFQLGFLSSKKADNGKMISVRYVDNNNIQRIEDVMLGDTPSCLTRHVKRVEQNGISLPIGLAGNITARTSEGLTLAEWQPFELVPGYRRIRVKHSACPGSLVIHAERKRGRILDLREPVETDQKLVWEDGARHLLLHRKVNGSGDDKANADKFLTSFKFHLDEEARRRMGRFHKKSLNFRGTFSRRSGLIRGR